MARDIRTNFVLDGEAKYKSALKGISLEMRLLDSELGKATAGLDKNADAMQFLSATSTTLQKKMDVQKQKIEAVAKELAETEKAYGENSDEAKRLAIVLNKAESELGKMAKELTDNDRKMEELKRSADDAGSEMRQFESKIDSAGDKARDASGKFENFGSALKTGLVKGAQAATVAVAALAAATGAAAIKLGKEVISAYADYEQLVGGVDTLFKESSQQLQEYAANAYKTAGLSANDYMETVTSFSASLISSLGGDTEKAVKYADMAITDMSDNANKMGTDMESIQNAYQGFAKQNYTMLDNLKLGYGGTKSEMERLLADAEAISGIEFDVSSYADIVSAIHVIQESMGVAGTTALEAEETISGSLNAFESAWQNLLVGFGNADADMEQLSNNMVDAFQSVVENITPVIENIVKALPVAIETLLPAVSGILVDVLAGVGKALPEVAKVLTSLITSAVEIVGDILPELMPILLDSAFVLLDSLLGAILDNVDPIAEMVTQLVLGLADFITENLPTVIEAAIQLVLAVATGILEALPEMMPAIMSMLQTIVDVVLGNLPLIIQTGLALLVAVIQGLQEARPQLAEMVPEIVQTIVDVIIDNLPLLISAGVDIIGAVIEGVLAEKMTLLAALPEIVNGIIDKFAETDWAQIGVDILLGIGNGIANTVGSVVDKAISAAEDIAGGIKDFFGIASPSKLMTEYGGFISEGLAKGIDAKSGLAQDAIDGLLPPTLDAKVSAEMLSSSELGGTVKKTVEHTGVIRVEGVNSEGQFVAAVDMIVNQLRRDAMMAGTI